MADVMEKTSPKDGDGKIVASPWEGASLGDGGRARPKQSSASRSWEQGGATAGAAGRSVSPGEARARPVAELPLAGGRGQACRA